MPHNGIDIGAPAGSHIRSAADGFVAYSDNTQPGYGNMMLIIHADGAVALYAHCLANYAFPGQKVTGGDIIGEVGLTGIARGAHLHFELRVKGVPRNPLPFFRKGLVEHSLDAGVDSSPHDSYDASGSDDESAPSVSDAGL
jgi:murein DD-endopeptidase MepM/ murein hydrolase activator NlpD